MHAALCLAAAITAASPGFPVPSFAAFSTAPAWRELTPHAAFPAGYNFPVHVAPGGEFVALHPEGTWLSRDGVDWRRGTLPFSGMNSAYLNYVQHDGATWALGLLRGNYLDFTVQPTIQRTTDYRRWEFVGHAVTLPQRIFAAGASFRGALWLLGGHDGRGETAEVWRSTDGLAWERVVVKAPWSARSGARAIVFRDRLWLIGGGRLDGPRAGDIWSSADGIAWVREAVRGPDEPLGGTPVVFGGSLWLVGANRDGAFGNALLVSDDGRRWRSEPAPWTPRGGVAAWTDGRALYLTGGKYSIEKRGGIEFVYSNDVWKRSE